MHEPESEKQREPEDRMTILVAAGIMALFAVAMVFAAATALVLKSDAWLELFKSGFFVLGAGLTTIIGYYFGSRGARTREEQAWRIQQRAEQELQRVRDDLLSAGLVQEDLAQADFAEWGAVEPPGMTKAGS